MSFNPLGGLAMQAAKSLLGTQGPKTPEQKEIEAQLARELAKVFDPLVARLQMLERRVAALEGQATPLGPRAERADDV
jgi:hypothetical protein